MGRLLRQLGFLTALALAGVYVFAMFLGPNGWPAMMHKRGELLELEKHNDNLIQQIKDEGVTIRQLKENGPARDRVIREKTKKQKRSETTIYFSGPSDEAAH